MAELYVDVPGLTRLYNQLVRASGDATDALDYVHKHCDLRILDQGFIMLMIGPHGEAYRSLTTALERLQTLTQGAGTQINRAQVEYSRTDHQSAKQLDAAYPGAKDPAAAASAFTSHRPDLMPDDRAAFTDVAEATRALQNPQYAVGIEMWDINPLADLVSPAAWLRQTTIWVFGHDPLEGWASQFSGDWKAYVHCGNAMGRAGAACRLISENIAAAASDIPQAWRGNAADGAREWLLGLAVATAGIAQVCSDYYDLYLQAAEAIKKLYDVVAGLITDLIDMLIIISGALAAGAASIATIFGPIAGFSIAAYYAWQAYDLYKQISRFYGAAEDTLKLIGGSIGALDATLSMKAIPDVQPYHHPARY
ncbi:hypothetical protein [Actinoplanes aureus]|uniref:Uncharacterized protein n=1 Tax=Actinoplanes aureus TaxID=2792083 RepID=A0A931CKP1_9ACTN|nr:hypothetical protein [Actinoplanes aureus]MBG0568181.1 hypothetical protein [Actinoplanes aureus]